MDIERSLQSSLSHGRIITDRDQMEAYRRDQATFSQAGHPLAVVVPSSIYEVQATLGLAHESGIPVVTRGAGSGLSGGANAVDGCIILVTSAMNAITDVDGSGMCANVEPGVLNADLKNAVRQSHLLYPPDPASSEFCSLGGNIATNAGGLCCVKYGTTGDYVLALDVVLADGRLLHTGSAARKSVAGYDLTRLFVGSEGTLGVVVGAMMRLVPAGHRVATFVSTFPSLDRVGDLPGLIARDGIVPSMLEVMDQETISAIEGHTPMGLDKSVGAMVVGQSDSPQSDREAERMAEIATNLGSVDSYHSSNPFEAEMLLQARKLAYPALERRPGIALLDDIAVPVLQTARLLEAITKIGLAHRLGVATFGHLADGNLHPTILFDPADSLEVSRAREAFDSIVWAALELGGTVTGEHGVGNLKTRHLERELDDVSKSVHDSVKVALDPKHILNPGKVRPSRVENEGGLE